MFAWHFQMYRQPENGRENFERRRVLAGTEMLDHSDEQQEIEYLIDGLRYLVAAQIRIGAHHLELSAEYLLAQTNKSYSNMTLY